MTESTVQMERIRRVLAVTALGGLGLLVYSTIHSFVGALVWAVILAVSLWPGFRWLRKRVPGPAWIAPLLMTFLITLALVVPLGMAALLLAGEAQILVEDVRAAVLGERGDLAEALRGIPFAGEALREKILALRARPEDFQRLVDENREALLRVATRLAGNVVRNLFELTVCLFSVFFLFRHGDMLAEQTRRAMNRLGGSRLEGLLPQIRATVRAVVYGLVMTALVQAGLAALGFYVAGVGYPLLLGLLTFMVSFIPFGPPLVWVPAGLTLLAEGRTFAGVGVLVWGAGAISTIDNFLRPLFIGQATRMPVLIVFLGVLGGVMSFGMVGLFVGPVVMAVALALWRDWVSRRPEARTPALPPAVPADLLRRP